MVARTQRDFFSWPRAQIQSESSDSSGFEFSIILNPSRRNSMTSGSMALMVASKGLSSGCGHCPGVAMMIFSSLWQQVSKSRKHCKFVKINNYIAQKLTISKWSKDIMLSPWGKYHRAYFSQFDPQLQPRSLPCTSHYALGVAAADSWGVWQRPGQQFEAVRSLVPQPLHTLPCQWGIFWKPAYKQTGHNNLHHLHPQIHQLPESWN